MLEASVSHSLAEYLNQQAGGKQVSPLLAVLSKQVDHHHATTTRLYRFYEADFQRSRVQHLAPSPLLPRELQITNLARTPQSIHKAYTSFEPVMASKANGPEAAAALAKLSASADQQVQQVDIIQEYTQSLLRDLSLACKVASGHSATLSSLQAEGKALQQQLADV